MEPIRDVLRSSLRRSLETLAPVDRLAAAWPVAAGHSISLRSSVAGMEDGAVTVEVDPGPWVKQLSSMAPRLREELERVAGVRVRTIHFQQRP